MNKDLVTLAARQLPTLLLSCALLTPGLAVSADDAALSDADMRRGRILFLQCRACHSLNAGDNEGKIGPSLAGVFTRGAGGASYYSAYSAALQEADHEWTSETMNRWITNPSAMVPGTSMVFAGVADAEQRDLLVRYLQVVTAPQE